MRAQSSSPQATPILISRTFGIGIGEANASDSGSLSALTWLLARSDGGCYVYDGRAERIVLINARGSFVRTIGGSGHGNGSFGHLAGGAILHDSLLALWDVTSQRVLVFSENGALRTTIQLPMSGRGYVSHSARLEFTADTSGRIYARTQASAGSREFFWLRFGLDGIVLDSMPDARPVAVTRLGSDGMRSTFGPDRIRVPYMAGGMLEGDPLAYLVAAYDARGPDVSFQHNYLPVDVVRAERAEWVKALTRRGKFSSAELDTLLPERKTAFRSLHSDRSGNIWVERNGLAHADSSAHDALGLPQFIWRDVTAFDVFSGTGRLMHSVTLPRHTSLLAIGERRLWLNETDVDGNTTIGVYDW